MALTRNLTIAVLAALIGMAGMSDAEAGRFGSKSRSGGGNHRSFGGGNHRSFGGGHRHRGHWGHKHWGHKHHWGHRHWGHKRHWGHRHHYWGHRRYYAHKPYYYRWNYYNQYRSFCEPSYYHDYCFTQAPAPVPAPGPFPLGAAPPVGAVPQTVGVAPQAVGVPPQTLGVPPQTVGAAPPITVPVAPAEITAGSWTAKPANNVSIMLTFGADSKFQWQQTIDGKDNSFAGSYLMENGTLNLTRGDNQQKLIGTVAANTGGFNFKLQNGDPQDPGLNFSR